MKTVMQASLIFMILVMTVIGCFNLMTASIVSTEVETSLTQSVEQALYVTLSDKAYTVDDEDAFVSDFLINLVDRIESPGDISVKIVAVDEEEGLIDVEVTETVAFPAGQKKEITCRRTVLFEETKNNT